MAKLAVLRHDEGIRLDPDCLVGLYADLGESGAEALVQRAMGELVSRLNEMQRCADQGDRSGLVRSARLLAKVAEQIGMTTFARVAGDVVQTAMAADMAAQAAVIARLVRIGERSLNAVWDLRGMTV